MPRVSDSDADKLNILGGTSAGQGESINFSFDHSGVLEEVFLDRMKDQTLEYFQLQVPGGPVVTLFDFVVEFRLR